MQHSRFTLANCSVPGKQTEPDALEVLSCMRSSSSKIAWGTGPEIRLLLTGAGYSSPSHIQLRCWQL